MTQTQPVLFENPLRPTGGGAIEAAARTTIAALEETGTLDRSHALKVELILAGARALDLEFQRDKVTVAATTLFSRVVEIADGLPTVQQAIDEKFREMAEALARD